MESSFQDGNGYTLERNSVRSKEFIIILINLTFSKICILSGSVDAEQLDVDWLDENGMDSDWRSRTFGKYKKESPWFRVPVYASGKQNSERKISKPSKKKTTSKKKFKKKLGVNTCVPGSLLKAFNYLGLQKNINNMKNVFNTNYNFQRFVQCVTGFSRKPLKNFNPMTDTKHNKLYLIQLSSMFIGNVNSNKSKDNTHAISIFNHIIFDNNMSTQLPLTKVNLDKCCVGGSSYVFKYCSRVVEFTPTKNTERIILKNLFKKR